MKKFLLSIVAILCAAFAANADVWTYNVEKDYSAEAPKGSTWCNNLCKSSGTTSEILPTATEGENALQGITWKYIQNGSSEGANNDGTVPKGIRWGSSKTQIGSLHFSTSGFAGKKITSVSVKICGNGGTNRYAVKVSCGEFAETKDDVLLNTTSNKAVSAVFSPNVTSTDLEFAIVYTGGTTNKGGVKFLEVSVSYEDSQEVVYPTSCSTPVFAVAGYKADVDTYGTFPGKTVSVSCDTPESSIIWSVFVNGGSEQKLTGDVFTIPVDAKAEDKYEFMAHGQVQGKDGMIESEIAIIKVVVEDVRGTKENPYTVADIINGHVVDANGIWVKGFIIGEFVNAGKKLNAGDATFESTSMVLADTKDGFAHGDALEGKAIPVELPDGAVREGLGLFANPSHLGKEVLVHANAENYFTLPGLKGTKDFELINPGPDTGVADVLDGSNGPVRYYDVNGRAVAADAKGILIKVQGGKAVKVFNK